MRRSRRVQGRRVERVGAVRLFDSRLFDFFRRLVDQQESARRGRMWAAEQKAAHAGFFHPGHARMLLITKTRSKNKDFYPTMCMIISHLVKNFQKLPIYFHRDKLWINPKARQFRHRTRDVYDRKGVNTKSFKSSPLFSIGYKEEKSEKCTQLPSEPTICMRAKGLSVSGRKAARSYAVEIRPPSVLAPRESRCRTHDVYDKMMVNPAMALSRRAVALVYPSLSIASTLVSQEERGLQKGPVSRSPGRVTGGFRRFGLELSRAWYSLVPAFFGHDAHGRELPRPPETGSAGWGKLPVPVGCALLSPPLTGAEDDRTRLGRSICAWVDRRLERSRPGAYFRPLCR